MSAAVIFLILICVVVVVGGLYFLGLPPFNKTERTIAQKIKDGDVDEDILREVVLDKVLNLEELGETITTDQATEIQDYFDLDDTHMPYVYETLGVTVEDTSGSENSASASGSENSASTFGSETVTGGPVTGELEGYDLYSDHILENGTAFGDIKEGMTLNACRDACTGVDECKQFIFTEGDTTTCQLMAGDGQRVPRRVYLYVKEIPEEEEP